MLELQIDPELKAWIDPLSTDEYALLEASILLDGCRDPLVVWGGYLLDGHNRYEICQKHGIEFATFEKSGLRTKDDAKIWMYENQIGKRNATDFSRTALALKLKPLLEQRARERMQAGKVDPTQNSAEGVGETRLAVAKVAGVSHDTVRKVEKIIEKASAEVIEQVRTGEISINAAAKTVSPPKVVAALDADPAPFVQPPQDPPPAAAPTSSDEVQALREQLAEVSEALKSTLADNEMMGRVFDADDQLKAAMGEAIRQKAIADNAERTLASKSGEFIERARAVTQWKNRAEKAEKALAKLEAKK